MGRKAIWKAQKMKIVTEVDLTSGEPIKTGSYICIELDTILKAICYVNNVNIFDVKGKRRFQELVMARREYSYLACKLTQLNERSPYGNSLAKIGEEISKDHATVLHHCKTIRNWLGIKSYGLKEKFELIEKQLKI